MSNENEERTNTIDDTMEPSQKRSVGDMARKAKSNYGKFKKNSINALKKFKASGPVVAFISSLGIILLIVFLTIGLVGFFITLPGLSTEKIINTAKNFWSWFSNDDSIEVDMTEVNSLADYIESLGYDIVGYGFAQSNRVTRDSNGNIKINENDDKEITKTRFSNLYAYIAANERTYTIRGSNLNIFGRIFDAEKIRNFWNDMWGIDAAKNGDYYGMLKWEDSGMINNSSIDRANNKLIIETGLVNKEVMTWDLSGWTSRYGKPIELSLALHLSTMSPDFVYNFCSDSDLQTTIELSTHDLEYKDIVYTYVKNGSSTAIKSDKVIEIYNKFSEKLGSIYEKKYVLQKDKETGERFPTEVLYSTSIVSVEENDTGNKKYYRALDENNTPIDLVNNKYDVKLTENGEPTFTLNDNGTIDVYYFADGSNNSVGMEIGKYKIRLELLSLNELGEFSSYFASDSESQKVYKNALKGKNDNISFISLEKYKDIISQFDSYINEEIIGKQEEFANRNSDIEILLKNMKYEQGKLVFDNGTAFSINSKYSETFKHNAQDVWDDVVKDIESKNFSSTSELIKWIKDEAEQLINSDAQLNDMLTGEIQEEIQALGLDSFDELEKLYKVFNSLTEKLSTYQPYIKSVTNHWYKDLYFEKDSGDSSYNFTEEITTFNNKEFIPTDEAVTDEIEELMQNGNFYYSGKSVGGIEQLSDPEIVTTEPWHYKVKNWLVYGYYFIYDGSEETAINIELAKAHLTEKCGYNEANPLLLDKYAEAGADQEKLYSAGIDSEAANEIDKMAQELNAELDEAGFNVRLQKIDFEKSNSLTAFSILETMHTEDSEYIYKDLKEFLIELGYFTYDDFESIETDVFEWLIPDYTVYRDEWPDSKYEKLDKEYGTYIRSKLSLDTQKYREGESNTSSSTSEISQTIDKNGNSKLVAVAKECWEYIVDSGKYTYAQAGIANISKMESYNTVDCSSFVSWVLYKYGEKYDSKVANDFAGYQYTSSSFMSENFNTKYGWTEIYADGDITSKVRAGDIVVTDSHVTFVKSIDSNGNVTLYNAGDQSHFSTQYRDGFTGNEGSITNGGSKKIIRVTGGGSAFTVNKTSENTTTTAGVEVTKVDASEYGEEGYATITTVNGISYKDYKQGTYPAMGVSSQYSQMYLSRSSDTFGYVGCGPTSTAIVLSAYGVTGKTGSEALPFVCGELTETHTGGTNSCENIKLAFDKYNIPATVYNVGSGNAKDTIDKALKEGKPVIANVNGGYYSPGGHYIAILGYDSSNKLVISNPCGNGIYGVSGNSVTGGVTLDYFVSNILGGGSSQYLIPDKVPSASLSSVETIEVYEVEGYETGLDVIMPEKGKIIEIGKVTDDEDNNASENTGDNSENTQITATTSSNTINKYIFIGDSRTEGMKLSVSEESNVVWSCKGSMGYDWMVNTGVPAIESQVTNGSAIFILMGINGLQGNDEYAQKYISYVDKKASEWAQKGATTYFVAIGPVNESIEASYGYSTRNSDIEYFNSKVKSGLKNARFIDMYSDLKSNGFDTFDGIHYTGDTYQKIYNFLKQEAGSGGSTTVEINPNDTSSTENIITKGDYVLIEFDTENGVDGWKMRIEGFDLDTVNVQVGKTLEKGEVIGITNEYNMKLILYDTKDAIINNIEDYFVLQERKSNSSSVDADKYEFFYFCIYESGVLSLEGNGPECVDACRPGVEHGVGICQWTTVIDGISNIQKVCEELYNLDNDLCAPLKKYIGMDNATLINEYAMKPSFENSTLQQDFKSICNKDREKFLELQMQIAIEEKYELFDDLGLSWVKERPSVVQGTLASLVNWGSALGWEDVINESMSDEDIIINLLKYACTKTSTVGSLNSRWNPQAKAALDILHGKIDAKKFCTDADYSLEYSTGTNGNFLSTQ